LGPFQNDRSSGPFQNAPDLGPFQNAPDLGPFQNAPDLGPFQKMLTCNEGEEVDAEYGEDLDLGLLVHVGVHRDGVVQQQRGPAHLPKQRILQIVFHLLWSSVADPDPHVFGLSGFISQMYGSGSGSGSFPFLIRR
jgi:hypothetical protein